MSAPDYHASGVINLAAHDTTPGARSPFAPPVGFSGDDTAYLSLMRRRYARNPIARQHMAVTKRMHRSLSAAVQVTGPYRAPALHILATLARSAQSAPAQATPAVAHKTAQTFCLS